MQNNIEETNTQNNDTQTENTATDDVPRYDVLITSQNAGYRAPRVAIGNMVQMLSFRGIASPIDEAIANDWIEIYFKPAENAHEIFFPKQYNGPQPIFYEAVLRFETDPFFAEYGKTQTPLHWSLEFRGCVFQNPLGPFRKLLTDALNLRPDVHIRPFSELPPHRIVPEDQIPIEKPKKQKGSGLAGTEVEEI